MSARILVVYATRHGSTAEIASAVGKELESAGHAVVVREMKTVTSLEGYDAIVIGAPIYTGKVIDINTFVRRFKDTIARKPVAAFAVGLAVVSKDPKQQEDSRKALDASLAPVKPVAVTLFGGVVNPTKLSFIQRKMTELAKSPIGDFRDWNAIGAWGRELPASMKL
jgi:menaquinone-dependent protoporphyrinogen oxidase